MATSLAPIIQYLLQDNFFGDSSGPANSNIWKINQFSPINNPSFYGRTQIQQSLPNIVGGTLQETVLAFNPPQSTFQGSEIISQQNFNDDKGGIAFTAVAKFTNPVPGLVGGIFLYNQNNTLQSANEIDSELLSNDAVTANNRIQTNFYTQQPLGAGNPQFVPAPSLTTYHTYTVEWFPNKVLWFVDGHVVRQTTSVPQGPMAAHINFWAPDTSFSTAFSASLQSTISPITTFDVQSTSVATTGPESTSDLFLQNQNSGQVAEWQVNGSSLTGGGPIGNNNDPSWHLIGVGDFNDDGSSDVLFQNENTGQVAEWQLNATSIIGGGIVGNNNDPSWHLIGTGSFNNDGFLDDVVLQNANTGQVAEWQLNGTSVVGGGLIGNNSADWHLLGVGDFNDDGFSDVVFQNVKTSQIAEWLMQGTSIIGGGVIGNNTDLAWQVVGTGDLHAAGASDIIFQNVNTGQIADWEMMGTSIVGGGLIGNNNDPNWRLTGIGDFNGDGFSDISFQNINTGQVAIWEMHGTSVVGGGIVSSSAWHLSTTG